MAFKKYGDWDAVMNMSRHMPEDIKASNSATLAVLAGRAESLAKKHMKAQDLKWQKLNPNYLAWKVSQGFDSRILIRGQDYLNKIEHDVNKAGTKAVAGVSKSAKNQDGEIIANYAKVMEYGSVARGVPARPLWKPVLDECFSFAKDNQIFAVSAIQQMRKRAGK